MRKRKLAVIMLGLLLAANGCSSKTTTDISDNTAIESSAEGYDSLFEKIEDDAESTDNNEQSNLAENGEEAASVTEVAENDVNEAVNAEIATTEEVEKTEAAESENETTQKDGAEASDDAATDDATSAEETASMDEAAVTEANGTADETAKSEDATNVENASDENKENTENGSEADKTTSEDSTATAETTDTLASATNTEAEAVTEQVTELSATPVTGGHIVVIDPGHQSKAMTDKEPNGPGSSTMKMKVTGGTAGRTTGLAEYQLALDVGLKLKAELINRGYTVIMTRESNDVSLSNVDRAQIANNANAEAFIRLHGNGSDDSSVNGAMTICQTPSNPYNGALYSQSRRLSDCVLDAFVAATGCNKKSVWETDTMTGINWANVPSTIIEMGFMTNPTEDTNMASAEYQQKMVIGIANGIDNYFAN